MSDSQNINNLDPKFVQFLQDTVEISPEEIQELDTMFNNNLL